MQKVYFTFGSSKLFPYQNGYMVALGEDIADAIETFREKYPDRSCGCVNCSSIYDETEWERMKKYYKDEEPKEVLVSERIQKNRLVVLLENAMKIALDNCECFTNEYQKPSMLKEMGCTEQELEELGVNVEGVFK